jgi:predicted ribosome quality control (RQC) complex YloA/Tae2 family protein
VIRHHVTLQHVADELMSRFEGYSLTRAWSQSKEIAILELSNSVETHLLECDVRSTAGTILLKDNTRRAIRNTIDVFKHAWHQRVALVTKHPLDRIITVWFGDCQLHIELFSAGKGNIVLVQDGVVVDTLHDKQNRIGRSFIVSSHQPHPPDLAKDAAQVLADLHPHLGKGLAHECCMRANIHARTAYNTLDQNQQRTLDQIARDILDQAAQSSSWFVVSHSNDVVLTPAPLSNSSILHTYSSVLQAVAKTIALREQRRHFEAQRTTMLKVISRRMSRVEGTLRNLRTDELRDTREHDYRHSADLLMALPDPHRRDLDAIDALDWNTDQSVRIPLQPALTILENAQRLYGKSRASQLAAQHRTMRIPALERELTELQSYMEQASTAACIQDLPHIPLSLARMNTPQPEKSPEEKFRVFALDDQHTLYVGKSAANNDELTMKFAKQQDWWLHVRGASGSHAVLRGVAGPKIPKQVLEAAAAITAYYSHARNASYVPVVYTQRKYVRKPKGANVGAVVIDKEQTVMVKPSLPAGTSASD